MNTSAPMLSEMRGDVYDQFRKSNQPAPYFVERSAPMLALESMVDAVGLRNVLYALEHIARAKSQHIAENWQGTGSDPLARDWNASATKCKIAANGVYVD